MTPTDYVHKFEGFLLLVSSWVAPWIAVLSTDWLLRGRTHDTNLDDNKNWAGGVAFVAATAFSVWGFAHQQAYVGPLVGDLGDVTPVVGFALAAVTGTSRAVRIGSPSTAPT